MNDDLLHKLESRFDGENIPELGPGPRSGCASVKTVTDDCEKLLASADLNSERRKLILGLVLLWNDHLDESHRISQEIGSGDGSYLHGIMHRREPDYSNAKYWCHRTGPHPVHGELAEKVRKYLERAGDQSLLDSLMPDGEWEAIAFVDACASVARRPDAETIKHLREIQRIEFELLMKHFVKG